MAQTFVELAGEATGRRQFATKPSKPQSPTTNLRRADAKEPWPGARAHRVSRVVQWMAETERAVLLYDFAAECQYWLPRWLWPRGAVVEMQGEAGPVALPTYFVGRLGL